GSGTGVWRTQALGVAISSLSLSWMRILLKLIRAGDASAAAPTAEQLDHDDEHKPVAQRAYRPRPSLAARSVPPVPCAAAIAARAAAAGARHHSRRHAAGV